MYTVRVGFAFNTFNIRFGTSVENSEDCSTYNRDCVNYESFVNLKLNRTILAEEKTKNAYKIHKTSVTTEGFKHGSVRFPADEIRRVVLFSRVSTNKNNVTL